MRAFLFRVFGVDLLERSDNTRRRRLLRQILCKQKTRPSTGFLFAVQGLLASSVNFSPSEARSLAFQNLHPFKKIQSLSQLIIALGAEFGRNEFCSIAIGSGSRKLVLAGAFRFFVRWFVIY